MSHLERVTRSPRFNRVFQKPFELVCLKGSGQTVNVPQDRKGWDAVLELVEENASSECPAIQDNMKEEILDNAAKIRRKSSSFPVHCECRLLEYFARTELEAPPVGYIGVSKLSCVACQAVFASWNKRSKNRQYRCRGCSGRWYSPWAMPRGFPMTKTEADALLDTVRQKLSQSFCETFSSAVNDRMSDSSMEPVNNQAPQQPVKEEHAMELFTSLRKYYPPE